MLRKCYQYPFRLQNVFSQDHYLLGPSGQLEVPQIITACWKSRYRAFSSIQGDLILCPKKSSHNKWTLSYKLISWHLLVHKVCLFGWDIHSPRETPLTERGVTLVHKVHKTTICLHCWQFCTKPNFFIYSMTFLNFMHFLTLCSSKRSRYKITPSAKILKFWLVCPLPWGNTMENLKFVGALLIISLFGHTV